MAPHRHGRKGVNSPYSLPEAPHIGPAPGRHVSCQNCRRRKMKCSRTFPCVSCHLRDEECEWQDAVPTRTEALDIDHAMLEITRLRSIVDDLALRLSQSPRFANLALPPSLPAAPRFHHHHPTKATSTSSISTSTSTSTSSTSSTSPFPSFLGLSPNAFYSSPCNSLEERSGSPASSFTAMASPETGYPFAPDTPPVQLLGEMKWGTGEEDDITEALKLWLDKVA